MTPSYKDLSPTQADLKAEAESKGVDGVQPAKRAKTETAEPGPSVGDVKMEDALPEAIEVLAEEVPAPEAEAEVRPDLYPYLPEIYAEPCPLTILNSGLHRLQSCSLTTPRSGCISFSPLPLSPLYLGCIPQNLVP